jgi:hypothetical protein
VAPRARQNIFGFGTKKVTYHRDVAKERRELRAHALEERKARLAAKKLEAQEQREREREEARELKQAEMAERKRKAEQKKADAVDRAIEREWREQGTRNPRANVTDRAKRYRAHANAPEGPKRCYFCPSRQNIDLHHLSNDEDDGEPENLMWACRSCNVKIANVMRKAGIGRITKQYNPPGGAKSLGQWMNAVMSMKGEAGGSMDVQDAVAMIRATSKNKRSEFAHDIWGKRSARRRNPTRNPEDAAADLSEAWHGRPASVSTDHIDQVRYHGVLTDLGRLKEITVMVTERKGQKILFDKDTRLASSENGKQLYVVGGDQSIDLAALGIDGEEAEKDCVFVGEVHSLVYVTAKQHLGRADKEVGPYEHHMGEDNGTMPVLIYDTLNEQVGFAGGSYFIDPTDYDGSHSAGIRN